jgi:hypothetical protein
MKQTAVEWLIQQIETGKIEIVYSDKIHSIRCLPEFVKESLEMEKQQIMEAYNDGQAIPPFDYAKKYYDRTFKKDNL